MADELHSAGEQGQYIGTVKELNSTDPKTSCEAARLLNAWVAKLPDGLGGSLHEQCRTLMRDMVDKFSLLQATDLGPGETVLHEAWKTKCYKSCYKHLIGCNSQLGVGRILALLLPDEADRGLLWKVCQLAHFGWEQEFRRMLGDNLDLGMHTADRIAHANAGAPDHPIVLPMLIDSLEGACICSYGTLRAMARAQSSCMREAPC